MTNLVGSEKQITWAEQIRENAVKLLEEVLTVKNNNIEVAIAWEGKENRVVKTEIQQIYKTEEIFNERYEYAVKTLETAKNIDSAKFWIDNREDIINALVKKAEVKSFGKIQLALKDMIK